MANTAENESQKLAESIERGSTIRISAALQSAHCQGKNNRLPQCKITQTVNPITALVAGIPQPDNAA